MDKIFKNKIIELLKVQMPNLHKAMKEVVRLTEGSKEPSSELLDAILKFHMPYLEFIDWVAKECPSQSTFVKSLGQVKSPDEPRYEGSIKTSTFTSTSAPQKNREELLVFEASEEEVENSQAANEMDDDEANSLLAAMDSSQNIEESQPKSDSISDDDAMRLLAEMDEPIAEEAEIDQDEAMRLLAEMDAPVKEEAEIDQDEAMRLLAEMDEPIAEEAEIDQDEAMRLLAEMDSPATSAGEIDEDEARMLLAEMDTPSSNTKSSPPKKTLHKSASEDDDLMALLNEVGGSETSTEEESHDSSQVSKERKDNLDTKSHKTVKNSPSSGANGHSSPPQVNSLKSAAEAEVEEFSGNEFADDPEMMKDFLSNADDLMENLDNQILALEQNPNSKEVIEEIFRAAHTLKGAAGMFGFKALERVMHRLENYFDLIRKQKANATPDSIDVVFEAMDVMKKLLQGVREGKSSGVLTGGLVTKLNQVCAGTYVKSGQSQPPVSAKIPDAPLDEPKAQSNPGNQGQTSTKGQAQQENSTIKVDIERLDALVNLVGELVIDRGRFVNIEEDIRSLTKEHSITAKMSETVQLFGRHMNEIQDIIMKVRMVPIGYTFNKFTRIVRDLSRQVDKNIELTIFGEDTELDKTLVEQLGDPLVHLIRNACDHGCETPEQRKIAGKSGKAVIELSARQEGNQIIISISDDGKGMDVTRIKTKAIEKGLIKEDAILSEKEIFNLIFEAGFSTVDNVTNLSGRGVGMDVVKRQITKLKGEIDIQSTVGKGSTITINLPLTLAIVQSLLVKSKSDCFAIPLSAVVESIRIHPSEIQKIGNSEVIKRRDNILPLVYLNQVLDLDSKEDKMWYSNANVATGSEQNKSHKRLFVVVIGTGDKKFGIVVDHLLNQQEMVIKPMGKLTQIPCVAGGAILGNGEAVLVLDIAEIESFVRQKNNQRAAA